MVNYQVIMLYDDELGKAYFDSYVKSDDTTLGNIQVTELPPYADIQKAKSCTYDSDNATWVFDEAKYAKIITAEEERKAAEEEAAAEAATVMSNAELTAFVLELAEMISANETGVVDETTETVAEESTGVDETTEAVE